MYVNRLTFQAQAYGTDPYKSFASNRDGFTSKVAPISMKVVSDANAQIKFKASSKADVSISKNTEEVGPEGALNDYSLFDPDSFMKVSLVKKLVHYAVCTVAHSV